MREVLTVGGPLLMVRAIASAFFGFIACPLLHIAQVRLLFSWAQATFCGNSGSWSWPNPLGPYSCVAGNFNPIVQAYLVKKPSDFGQGL